MGDRLSRMGGSREDRRPGAGSRDGLRHQVERLERDRRQDAISYLREVCNNTRGIHGQVRSDLGRLGEWHLDDFENYLEKDLEHVNRTWQLIERRSQEKVSIDIIVDYCNELKSRQVNLEKRYELLTAMMETKKKMEEADGYYVSPKAKSEIKLTGRNLEIDPAAERKLLNIYFRFARKALGDDKMTVPSLEQMLQSLREGTVEFSQRFRDFRNYIEDRLVLKEAIEIVIDDVKPELKKLISYLSEEYKCLHPQFGTHISNVQEAVIQAKKTLPTAGVTKHELERAFRILLKERDALSKNRHELSEALEALSKLKDVTNKTQNALDQVTRYVLKNKHPLFKLKSHEVVENFFECLKKVNGDLEDVESGAVATSEGAAQVLLDKSTQLEQNREELQKQFKNIKAYDIEVRSTLQDVKKAAQEEIDQFYREKFDQCLASDLDVARSLIYDYYQFRGILEENSDKMSKILLMGKIKNLKDYHVSFQNKLKEFNELLDAQLKQNAIESVEEKKKFIENFRTSLKSFRAPIPPTLFTRRGVPIWKSTFQSWNMAIERLNAQQLATLETSITSYQELRKSFENIKEQANDLASQRDKALSKQFEWVKSEYIPTAIATSQKMLRNIDHYCNSDQYVNWRSLLENSRVFKELDHCSQQVDQLCKETELYQRTQHHLGSDADVTRLMQMLEDLNSKRKTLSEQCNDVKKMINLLNEMKEKFGGPITTQEISMDASLLKEVNQLCQETEQEYETAQQLGNDLEYIKRLKDRQTELVEFRKDFVNCSKMVNESFVNVKKQYKEKIQPMISSNFFDQKNVDSFIADLGALNKIREELEEFKNIIKLEGAVREFLLSTPPQERLSVPLAKTQAIRDILGELPPFHSFSSASRSSTSEYLRNLPRVYGESLVVAEGIQVYKKRKMALYENTFNKFKKNYYTELNYISGIISIKTRGIGCGYFDTKIDLEKREILLKDFKRFSGLYSSDVIRGQIQLLRSIIEDNLENMEKDIFDIKGDFGLIDRKKFNMSNLKDWKIVQKNVDNSFALGKLEFSVNNNFLENPTVVLAEGEEAYCAMLGTPNCSAIAYFVEGLGLEIPKIEITSNEHSYFDIILPLSRKDVEIQDGQS